MSFVFDPNNPMSRELQQKQHKLLTAPIGVFPIIDFARENNEHADIKSLEDVIVAIGTIQQMGLFASSVNGANVERLRKVAESGLLAPWNIYDLALFFPNEDILARAREIADNNCPQKFGSEGLTVVLQKLQEEFPEILTEEVMMEITTGITL